MIINRYFDASAYFIVDEFLPREVLELFLKEIAMLELQLSAGMAMQGGRRTMSEIKRNRTVNLASDHPIARRFRECFWCREMKTLIQGQTNRIYQNMFHPRNEKVQLSVYNDGDFYGPHKDGKSVTVNFFLYGDPKKFEGGDLLLRTGDQTRIIECINNRLLMFDGMTLHEVTPIRCSSGEYPDSRFSIQYWANRQQVP